MDTNQRPPPMPPLRKKSGIISSPYFKSQSTKATNGPLTQKTLITYLNSVNSKSFEIDVPDPKTTTVQSIVEKIEPVNWTYLIFLTCDTPDKQLLAPDSTLENVKTFQGINNQPINVIIKLDGVTKYEKVYLCCAGISSVKYDYLEDHRHINEIVFKDVHSSWSLAETIYNLPITEQKKALFSSVEKGGGLILHQLPNGEGDIPEHLSLWSLDSHLRRKLKIETKEKQLCLNGKLLIDQFKNWDKTLVSDIKGKRVFTYESIDIELSVKNQNDRKIIINCGEKIGKLRQNKKDFIIRLPDYCLLRHSDLVCDHLLKQREIMIIPIDDNEHWEITATKRGEFNNDVVSDEDEEITYRNLWNYNRNNLSVDSEHISKKAKTTTVYSLLSSLKFVCNKDYRHNSIWKILHPLAIEAGKGMIWPKITNLYKVMGEMDLCTIMTKGSILFPAPRNTYSVLIQIYSNEPMIRHKPINKPLKSWLASIGIYLTNKRLFIDHQLIEGLKESEELIKDDGSLLNIV